MSDNILSGLNGDAHVTIDGEERVTIIEYALVDGVLYFTDVYWL